METRSRKRAETATAQRPSPLPTNKKARFSAPLYRPTCDRLRPTISRFQEVSMHSTPLPFSSSASKIVKKELDKDEGSEEYLRKPPTSRMDRERESSDKGKEKEQHCGGSERERPLALVSDDEHHDVEGNSSLQHNLASASSALHGLLRKLGAGLDDLLPSSSPNQSSKLKRILSSLRADGEEGRQLEALTQLCEMLSIGTEESLSSFSVDSFVPVLVGLLNHEHNPDMMLLAARAITHLCDVLPSSCAAVVHYGTVPCLCARLLTIEYIDLAEQSLQALEKISHEHPAPCLRAGALLAVLSYLDFFSTGVQRVAVSTAANICRQLSSDASDFVTEAVPILTNLLQYQDSKVVEHASVCLTRIAESFVASPEKLDLLFVRGLIAQVVRLISVSVASGAVQTPLSNSTYTGLVRLLSTCASGSAIAAESLLLSNISGILKEILAGHGSISSLSISPVSVSRPSEQLYELITLVNELLPPIPQPTALSSSTTPSRLTPRKQAGSSSLKNDVGDHVSMREKLLLDHPDVLLQFGMDLLPVLMQVYGSSVNPPIRHKCLAAMCKLVHISTAEMLRSLLKDLNISSFLAVVLGLKDSSMLLTALHIAEMLMQKLPDIFTRLFVKEGVVHAVDKLIGGDPGSISTLQPASSSGRNGRDASAGHYGTAPGRPWRGTRRRSCSSEAGLVEQKGSHVGSPPSSSAADTSQSSKVGLRFLAISTAKRFKEMYFSADLGMVDVLATESLSTLKALCVKLNSENMLMTKGKWKGKGKVAASGTGSRASNEVMLGALADILAELGRGDGVSTFEFVGSGIVGSLLNFFSGGGHGRDNVSDARFRQETMDRMKQFIAFAIPPESEGNEAPLTVLVRKLQDALSSLECFPVILSHAPSSGTGSASVAAGLSALAQPFKLRLCRALGERGLREYSSNIVLIDPLATLFSIEGFLWPRVQRSDPSHKSSVPSSTSLSPSIPAARPATRSRSLVSETTAVTMESPSSASVSKGKGKVGAQTANELKGPETRNGAARRMAASAATSVPRPKVQKDFGTSAGSEDEDVEISPVEVDEALDDDISEEDDEGEEREEVRVVFGEEPVSDCMGEAVYTVRLGVDGGAMGSGASTSATTGNASLKPSNFSSGLASIGSRSTILTGGLDVNGLRIGSSLPSRNSLSFAAAAMAGLASTSGRGLQPGRDRHSLASSGSSPPRLNFSLGGKPLNRSWTIFQAVRRQAIADEDDDERLTGPDYSSGEGKKLWDEVYTIHYQRVEAFSDHGVSTSSSLSPSPTSSSAVSIGGNSDSPRAEGSWQQCSLLDSILLGELPCDLDKANPTYSILLLLRVLHGLNRLAPRLRRQAILDAYAEGRIAHASDMRMIGPLVHQEEFLSRKLTPKLARQMQDALALCSGGLPPWCCQLTKACHFLFSFETRRQYFYSTALGLPRALQRLQQQQSMDNANSLNDRELRIGRLQRQKVRVSRNRILDSAAKVMELYSGHKSVLEVEFFGEVGTGLGPTLEFYTLLSRDLQKLSLDMWRASMPASVVADDMGSGDDMDMQDAVSETLDESPKGQQEGEYVHALHGLFPRPWPPVPEGSRDDKHAKVIEHFRLLGRTMGKALQDGRLLDLPLSTAFYKLVLGQELDLHDLKLVDPELGRTLQEMQNLVVRKQFLESSSGANNKQAPEGLRFRDTMIEDLCLDFTLPGYPEYELKPEGKNMRVNLDNLEDYVTLVVNATMKAGITPQMEAFCMGFNQVLQISSLQIFNEEELDYLLCGCREAWTAETLVEHIKFDHGYTASSPPIRNLLEIMGEFTPEQQRAFLCFVTGAPRLPLGGLSALNPKLTIVRKHPTGSSGVASAVMGSTPPGASVLGTPLADGDLPSVMTCANYLKLPPYSCKEAMRERLLFAILEGQGSFDLS